MNSGTKMWMVIVIIVLSLVAAGMSTLTWLNSRKGNRMKGKMRRRAYDETPETDDTEPENSPEESPEE